MDKLPAHLEKHVLPRSGLAVAAENAAELRALLAPLAANPSVRQRYEDGNCLELALVLAASLPQGEGQLLVARQPGNTGYHFAVAAFGDTWDVSGPQAIDTWKERYTQAHPQDPRPWGAWRAAVDRDFEPSNARAFHVDVRAADLALAEVYAGARGQTLSAEQVLAVKSRSAAAEAASHSLYPAQRESLAPVPEAEAQAVLAKSKGMPFTARRVEQVVEMARAEPTFEVLATKGYPVRMVARKNGELADIREVPHRERARAIDLAKQACVVAANKGMSLISALESVTSRLTQEFSMSR